MECLFTAFLAYLIPFWSATAGHDGAKVSQAPMVDRRNWMLTASRASTPVIVLFGAMAWYFHRRLNSWKSSVMSFDELNIGNGGKR